jgi:hypothetical protein
MKAKEKATEIFFEQWFKIYNQLHKQALNEANDFVDLKIISDKDFAEYWKEVKRELSLFKG